MHLRDEHPEQHLIKPHPQKSEREIREQIDYQLEKRISQSEYLDREKEYRDRWMGGDERNPISVSKFKDLSIEHQVDFYSLRQSWYHMRRFIPRADREFMDSRFQCDVDARRYADTTTRTRGPERANGPGNCVRKD